MTNDKSAKQVADKKQKKRTYSKITGIASLSFLIALFDKICNTFCDALTKGFFGTVCSSYTKLQTSFENGFIREFIIKDRKLKRFFRRCRKFLSSNIENCFIVTGGQRVIRFLCAAPLNFHGNFFLFFGFYTVVVYFVKTLIPEVGSASLDYLIVGGAAMIISLPLLFSHLPLADAVSRSKLGKLIFQNCFGFSDEVFAKYSTKRKGKGNIMLFFGLFAGTLTFFFHPLKVIQAIALISAGFMIAGTPEIGVIITVFAVPLCSFMSNPTLTLCALVILTSFFYVIKLIRGKRVIKFEIFDIVVTIFAVLIYLSGVFSAGGESSKNVALVCVSLIFGYFLLVNLMRTEKWINRCVASLVGSATIVAAWGIVEFFIGGPSNSAWLDKSFSAIKIRVISLFENPNILGTYLVMVLPFVFVYLLLARKRSGKIFAALICAVFVFTIVCTWSRAAWIATVVGTLLFFTIFSRKTLRALLVLVLSAPIISVLIPETVVQRIVSIFNLSDSSISYRIYTWFGSMRAIKDNLWGGIGFGQEAFEKIYPQYAYAGMETAEHTHSLYLQLILMMGIGGLLTFAVLIFLYFQKTSEYIKKPENARSKYFVAAAFTSVISALIMGVFDYIWYNNRVFFIFWIVIAIGCAFVRVGNSEMKRQNDLTDEYSSDEIDAYN